MALAQADMLARNQLKLNLFSALAYQESGAAPLPRDLPRSFDTVAVCLSGGQESR